MNIALVLLTHYPDEPAGVERSVASLAVGLRELGHRVVTIAAGPGVGGPDLVRLKTVTLPRPMLFDDLSRLAPDPEPMRQEVLGLLREHEIDVVCWTDAVVGLGFLDPAPAGVRRALMMHFLRVDEPMKESLSRAPDAVFTPSAYLIDEAARAGLDTSGWQALPNALLSPGQPADDEKRERLRRTAPIRVVARADPAKGVAELLRAYPAGLGRPVQIVLAEAGFELHEGGQRKVVDECRVLAADLPDVQILPPLRWHEVQPFFADASLTIVPSTVPETFGNVPAEALSAGTPVVAYGWGNLPRLIGTAGRLVGLDVAHGFGHVPELTGAARRMTDLSQGPAKLWHEAMALLADRKAYHAAARQAPRQVAEFTPAAVAQAFLDATWHRALP